jgi:hypothetical protein
VRPFPARAEILPEQIIGHGRGGDVTLIV